VSYSEAIFAADTIDALGQKLLLAMSDIVDAACSRDTNATVAADFPLAGLGAQDLDSVASQLAALDD
jgi:hypothetical protein